jgi:hypothetical protein
MHALLVYLIGPDRQPHMLALQAHAQHMRVLRAYRHDERQAQHHASRKCRHKRRAK